MIVNFSVCIKSCSGLFWAALYLVTCMFYDMLRGCSHTMSAENGGLKASPSPSYQLKSEIGLLPPRFVRKNQNIANPPSCLVRNHNLLHSNFQSIGPLCCKLSGAWWVLGWILFMNRGKERNYILLQI